MIFNKEKEKKEKKKKKEKQTITPIYTTLL